MSTTREIADTNLNPTYTEDNQISYPLQTRRQNTLTMDENPFVRSQRESQDQSWFMRGGELVLQRVS